MTRKRWKRLGVGSGIVFSLLAVGAVVMWQQHRIHGLAAANVALREEADNAASAQAGNRPAAADLAGVTERADAQLDESARLGTQASRRREPAQESVRPESESGTLPVKREPEKPDLEAADEDTPEWHVARSAMIFSKELGFALHAHAQTADGQMPRDLFAALESLEPDHFEWFISKYMTEGSSFEDVKEMEFEVVYDGHLYEPAGRSPNEVIVVRQKEPLQLSNGRWARACLFGDGSSRVLVADSLDELAAQEDEYAVSDDMS